MDWKNKPNQIFNKVKQQMFAKGVESFHFVDQQIQHFDNQNRLVLSSHFFNLLLNKVGVFLTTQEIRNVRDVYAKDKEDLIQYKDFFEDIKYSISEKIAALIGQSFDSIDPQNKRIVSVEHLLALYRFDQHPHVLTRRKSAQEIKDELIAAISRKSNKGAVTKEAFVDYYAQLNFCIPVERQTYFEQLLVGTWGLVNPADYVSPKRLREIELTLYEKIREKSDGKTNEWKTAKKAISYFDLGDQKAVSYQTFARSLDKFGCNFKAHETLAVFKKYDTNQNGLLDYQQFSKMIMDLDINGMSSQPNLLTTMGTNHFKVTH